MRSASTPSITAQIRDDILLARTRTKPVCLVEYYDDDLSWKELLHVTSVSISTEAIKSNFGEASYVPSASTCSMSLVNLNEVYTPESGNDLDHVLRNDREIRVSMGYDLETETGFLLTEDGDTLTSEASEAFILESNELIAMGTYFIDDPTISNEFGNNSISISGRDAFKRAMENSISSTTYTSTDVGEILRDYLTLAGIPNSSATIPNLGTTITVSSVTNITNVRTSEAINGIMSYINAVVGGYRLFINEDGYAEIRAIPSDYTVFDYEMDYFNHLLSSSYTYKKNQSINRCDVFRVDHTVSAQAIVATATQTSTGTFTTSWANPSVYLAIDANFNASDDSIDIIIDQVSTTSVIYTITGSGAVDVDLTFRACQLSATPPYIGSAISWGLHKDKNGITKKIVNPFVQSSAEARRIAEKVIEDYGVDNPMVASFAVPGNPLLEPMDRVMVADLNSTKKNLYAVEALSHNFDYTGTQFKTNVRMKYSGVSIIAQEGDLLEETGDSLLAENSNILRIE